MIPLHYVCKTVFFIQHGTPQQNQDRVKIYLNKKTKKSKLILNLLFRFWPPCNTATGGHAMVQQVQKIRVRGF